MDIRWIDSRRKAKHARPKKLIITAVNTVLRVCECKPNESYMQPERLKPKPKDSVYRHQEDQGQDQEQS